MRVVHRVIWYTAPPMARYKEVFSIVWPKDESPIQTIPLPSSKEVFQKATELLELLYRDAPLHPERLNIAGSVLAFQHKLLQLACLHGAIQHQARRGIGSAAESIGMPHSNAYYLLRTLDVAQEDVQLAQSMDELLPKIPILVEASRHVMHMLAQLREEACASLDKSSA